ncbi:hypothetical protein AYL99_08332 [Fonsecaea erecta]|uniref:Uncharacterized protein n=1 Tax=Fonsecaea erecta TaxID=1367422 RepID=A0A178ZCS3_9EURO|nr:hypothetical protein AYL99_08332 [Fonsecaea erecta]OAP57594.1 hypothetical protein AYL99_08332 [Fonsecaea erecta]
MPPQRRRAGDNDSARTTAFGRAYPNLQRALLLSIEVGPFLLIATILTSAGIWKRPKWQRAMLWRAAVWSFLSRWILVGCAITWTWNDWGPEEQRQQPDDFQQEQRQDEGHGDQPRQEQPPNQNGD